MKFTKATLSLTLLLTALSTIPALADNAATFKVNAVKVSSAPVIDGILGDEAWDVAATANSKVVMDYNAGGGRTAYPATAYVTWDEKNLYLAYNIPNPDAANMDVSATERDGEVWADDEVEFFADPVGDGVTYFQVCVNSQGVILDNQAKDASWDAAGIKVGTAKEATKWTVEVAVPFADLGASIKSGATWKMNFTGHQKFPEDKWISWTTANSFHDIDTFGTVKFVTADI